MLIAGGHDQRAGAAHLFVQEADRIVLPIVGAERIRADEFSETIGFVGFGRARGAHFMKDDGNAGARDLMRGFRACKASSDNMNGGSISSYAQRFHSFRIISREAF